MTKMGKDCEAQEVPLFDRQKSPVRSGQVRRTPRDG